MPAAMVVGAIFHSFFGRFAFLSPYLIATMLFITFTRVKARELKLSRIHVGLLAFQILACVVVYLLLRPVNEVLAQGMMICAFAPAAMASVVIGGMLGANVTTMTTYTLISNMAVAFTAPVLFSVVGTNVGLPFFYSFWLVFRRLLLLVVLPFCLSFFCEKFVPKVHDYFHDNQQFAFYIWAVSLLILIGTTTNFILAQPRESYLIEAVLAASSLVLCLCQFGFGRWWGRRCGDRIAGGQSLGQKNTLLAILLAQTYLNPLSSVAPAAYVVWQNIVNSIQLARHKGQKEIN